MASGTTLGKAYVQIMPSAEGISGSISKLFQPEAESAGKSSGSSFSLSFGRMLGGATQFAAAAVGTATAAISAFAASSVNVGKEFDASMSQVAATMGKSADEIRDLRDFAQEMGRTTAFSATQAADALNYMALAGYDSATSMEMLPNVLNLAAAGGIDLAYASDMVTDAQSALGLTTEEAAVMVDQMAMASSKTNTSVSQLGEAILTIGATARNVNGGTAELTQVLGLLADNGIKGAEGGTHLRNMILSLQNPTKDAAAAIEKLGFDVYDADGNMRALPDIFADISAGMEGMTQESKDALISGIFNKTDLAAVNALLNTNAERWEEVAGNIAEASMSQEEMARLQEAFDSGDMERYNQLLSEIKGSAQEMADTQLDNLAGDITLFQSALEGAKIAVSDVLTPSLRDFVKFGTDGISQLTEAFQEGGLEGAMEALGGILGDGLAMVTEKLPGFVSAGMNLIGALGQGIMDNLPAMLQAAGEILSTVGAGIMEALPDIAEAALTIIATLASGLGESYPELLPAVVDVVFNIIDTLTSPNNIDMMLSAAWTLLEGLAEGLTEAGSMLLERGPEVIENLVAGITERLPEFLTHGVEFVTQLVMGIVEGLPSLLGSGMEIINSLIGAITSNLPLILEAGVTLLMNLIQGIIDNLPQLVQSGIDIIMGLNEAILSNLPTIIEAGIELCAQLQAGIIQAVPQLLAQLPQIISQIGAAFTGVDWGSVGRNILSGIANGLRNGVGTVIEAAKNAAKSAFDAAKRFLGISSPSKLFMYIGEMTGEGLAEGIEGSVGTVQGAMDDVLGIARQPFDAVVRSDFTAGYTAPAEAGRHEGEERYTVEIPVNLDGRQVARVIAPYTKSELTRLARNEDRKLGYA